MCDRGGAVQPLQAVAQGLSVQQAAMPAGALQLRAALCPRQAAGASAGRGLFGPAMLRHSAPAA